VGATLLAPTCSQLVERLVEEAASLLEAAGFDRGPEAGTAERAGAMCALRVVQDPSTGVQLVLSSEVRLAGQLANDGRLHWTLTAAPIELDELGLSAYDPGAHRLEWLLASEALSLGILDSLAQVRSAVESTLLTAWAVQNERHGRWSPANRIRWAGALEEWLRP
jgi:hypothetical protein